MIIENGIFQDNSINMAPAPLTKILGTPLMMMDISALF